jgi:hypothetical protein
MTKVRLIAPALTVGLSLVFCVVGWLLAEPPLLGLTVGLIGVLIGLQVEILLRLIERADAHDVGSKILAELDTVPALRTDFHQMACAVASDVRTTHSRIFAAVAQDITAEKVREARRSLQRLSEGSFEQRPDSRLLVRFVKESRRSIQATSLWSTEADFWDSEEGRNYWDANIHVHDKYHVEITRVFIHDGPIDAQLLRNLTLQEAGEVRLWTVDRSQLADVDDGLLVLVFDDELTQEITLQSGRAASYRFSSDRADVDRAKDRFWQIQKRATRWHPPSA